VSVVGDDAHDGTALAEHDMHRAVETDAGAGAADEVVCDDQVGDGPQVNRVDVPAQRVEAGGTYPSADVRPADDADVRAVAHRDFQRMYRGGRAFACAQPSGPDEVCCDTGPGEGRKDYFQAAVHGVRRSLPGS